MRLRLTEEEAAFREEMRTFFTTEIPQDVRDDIRAGRHIGKDGFVRTMRAMNAAGIAVPNWPLENARDIACTIEALFTSARSGSWCSLPS